MTSSYCNQIPPDRLALQISKQQETPLLGRRVVINGLVAKPELNGRPGTAMSFDDDKGWYSVALDGTSSLIIIKPCHLLPVCCNQIPPADQPHKVKH
jgi:hypothetical protein